MINVISGDTWESVKKWKNKNLSGSYQMVREKGNNRSVYKVSFMLIKPSLHEIIALEMSFMFLFQREEKDSYGNDMLLWYK